MQTKYALRLLVVLCLSSQQVNKLGLPGLEVKDRTLNTSDYLVNTVVYQAIRPPHLPIRLVTWAFDFFSFETPPISLRTLSSVVLV